MSRSANPTHKTWPSHTLYVEPPILPVSSVILELRAAMGGEESALFCAELLRAYLRLAERRGWQHELLERSVTTRGGLRQVVLRLSGKNVNVLLAEAGAHRVRRTPATEKAGRLHTSVVTCAVLPVVAEDVRTLDLREVRFDTYRSSGPGGQNMQKTESAVRATHIPSGLSAAIEDERSQQRNRARALELLAARLAAARRETDHVQTNDQRRAMAGSGHIVTRRRTYAFREGVVIDHRSGIHARLDAVLDGDFGALLEIK